jgi:hypothetical protein
MKKPGTGSANEEEIKEYANADRENLQAQIAGCAANLIVCCGTGDIVKEHKLIPGVESWKTSITGMDYAVVRGQVILCPCHPNAHVKLEEAFFLLTDTYRRVKKQFNLP